VSLYTVGASESGFAQTRQKTQNVRQKTREKGQKTLFAVYFVGLVSPTAHRVRQLFKVYLKHLIDGDGAEHCAVNRQDLPYFRESVGLPHVGRGAPESRTQRTSHR
jgi:hypothetical protein